MELFEEAIGAILTDFRDGKTNYPQAIIAIEHLILDRLGFTLAMTDRALKIERQVQEQVKKNLEEIRDANKRNADKVPIGTKITFKETMTKPADDHSPEAIYATQGEHGSITGHDDVKEGYWVKTDTWDASFGASRDEFLVREG